MWMSSSLPLSTACVQAAEAMGVEPSRACVHLVEVRTS
jgi:hypothetical protein